MDSRSFVRRATLVAVLAAASAGFGAARSVAHAATTSTKATATAKSTKAAKASPTTTTAPAKDVKTDIERKIVVAQQGSAPDLTIGKATCPKALAVPTNKVPVGTFECSVVVDGTVAPYEVILSNTGGFQKGGTYRIAPAKAIIDTAKIVAFVSSSLDEADRAVATIACGKKRVVVLDPGKTLTCIITRTSPPVSGSSTSIDTAPQTLTFLVKDKDGRVALQT